MGMNKPVGPKGQDMYRGARYVQGGKQWVFGVKGVIVWGFWSGDVLYHSSLHVR